MRGFWDRKPFRRLETNRKRIIARKRKNTMVLESGMELIESRKEQKMPQGRRRIAETGLKKFEGKRQRKPERNSSKCEKANNYGKM